jgi:hypothetical protein
LKKIKKIFGEINITWPKLIISAIIVGIYTALMTLIPALKDTSFHDIAVTFEVWILFGIIIIMNSKSAADSALKCFVFFLISQPITYLIQVPYNSLGFKIFIYYKYWFIWTILTIPMGFIGYYMKKNKWWSILILIPMLLFLGIGSYYTYLIETLYNFPYHLLTTLFCLTTMLLYPLCIFDNKKNKIITFTISIIIIICLTILAFNNRKVYNATLLVNNSMENVIFNENCNVYLEKDLGEVYIKYDEGIEDYLVEGNFKKAGKTNLTLVDQNGNKTVFELNIGNNTFDISKK